LRKIHALSKTTNRVFLENLVGTASAQCHSTMKKSLSQRRTKAFTLEDMLIVIVITAVLAVLLLPALASHHGGGQRISCANNVKEVNLSYNIWAGDNNGKYPMDIPVLEGGSKEYMNSSDAWRTFQVMSNELSTPKILYCPEDAARGSAATNFGDGLKNKISYFIGVDAAGTNETVLLSGDDHFLINGSPVKPGLVDVTSNTPIAWDSSRHVSVETHFWFFKDKTNWGNIGLGDGSVQSMYDSYLRDQVRRTGLPTNRLAIP
jgi:competence protein ComGC